MATHVKAVATLHTVLGVLGILGSIAILLFYGGLATVIGLAADHDDSVVAIPILGAIFGLGAILLGLISLPSLIGGIGLLLGHNWGRVLVMIVSCLELIKFPFGTALGVYSLWALTNKEFQMPSPVSRA